MPRRPKDLARPGPGQPCSRSEDSTSPFPTPRARWQAVSAWALVVAAIIPLLLIIFVPQDLPPEPGQDQGAATTITDLKVTNAVRLTQDFDFSPPPELEESPSDSPIATGTSVPTNPEAASIPLPSTSPPLPSRRVLRRYRAEVTETGPPPVLPQFEVYQVGRRIELRDQDGSVYRGQVVPLLNPEGPAGSAWTCEVRGTNATLNLPIAVAGNFQPDTVPPAEIPPPPDASVAPQASSPPAPLLDLPFKATLLIQGRDPIEIRALPVGP